MQTASGQRFYPADPQPDAIDIRDIAHALGNICRFGGHCNRFYSVAEHSVLVAQVLPRELRLQGLLHDATEAYCVDVPRPLKVLLGNYAEIEHRIWEVIAKKFDVPVELDPRVKQADNDVLLAEKAALLGDAGEWTVPGTPAQVDVCGLRPRVASSIFLMAFSEYCNG